MKRYKIKHKIDGWTGTMELEDQYLQENSSSSHSFSFTITQHGFLVQDNERPDGTYVEDPEIKSLDELEIEEIL